MKKTITLAFSFGVKVEIAADVVRGIAIHRPVSVQAVAGAVETVFLPNRWQLTHAATGCAVLYTFTLAQAKRGRAILSTLDLDAIAALPLEGRTAAIPADHPIHAFMADVNSSRTGKNFSKESEQTSV